jgi:hypothetical protein
VLWPPLRDSVIGEICDKYRAIIHDRHGNDFFELTRAYAPFPPSIWSEYPIAAAFKTSGANRIFSVIIEARIFFMD